MAMTCSRPKRTMALMSVAAESLPPDTDMTCFTLIPSPETEQTPRAKRWCPCPAKCARRSADQHCTAVTAVLLGRRCRTVRSYRSEEHTSELQSLMRISYAVFCLKKKTTKNNISQYK